MRVDTTRAIEPREATTRGAAREVATREVLPRRTVAKPSELKGAISRAYSKLHGQPIPAKMLDVLTAQACQETGLGASMFNFNFGGIKGASPEGMTAKCKTTEILGGEEKHITDGFRAYGSITDGATDYLKFLERRFPQAVESAKKGDVEGFVGHLKAGRYFTADETAYASGVKRLLGATDDMAPNAVASTGALPSIGALGEFVPPPDASKFADSSALSRVFDALSASSASIAAPTPDDEA